MAGAISSNPRQRGAGSYAAASAPDERVSAPDR